MFLYFAEVSNFHKFHLPISFCAQTHKQKQPLLTSNCVFPPKDWALEMFQCEMHVRMLQTKQQRSDDTVKTLGCTVSFAVFAYLAGLKLGQTLPAICCGCDISLELPMAAVSLPGCYEMPRGAADPNLTLANRGVVMSEEACALGIQQE